MEGTNAGLRVVGITVAALAAIYGYVTLALAIAGHATEVAAPAVAGSAGSLALVALRVQSPRSSHRRATHLHGWLLSGHLALGCGLAGWAAADAGLRLLGWPGAAALGGGEMAFILTACAAWPFARRVGRRWTDLAARRLRCDRS